LRGGLATTTHSVIVKFLNQNVVAAVIMNRGKLFLKFIWLIYG